MSESTDERSATLVLNFGDEGVGNFRAHRLPNLMLLQEYLPALMSGNAVQAARAAVLLAQEQVLPEEVERLRVFLTEHGRSNDFVDTIYVGLDPIWRDVATFPFVPSSDSGTSTPPSTTSGDESTPASSSPATVESPAAGGAPAKRVARKSSPSRASRSAASSQSRTRTSAKEKTTTS